MDLSVQVPSSSYVDHEKRHFFARVEWELDRVQMNADDLQSAFREEVADVFGMQWSFWPGGRSMRLAIFVTTEMAHLYDLLMRSIAGLWNAEVVLIVSNKEHLGAEAERFGVAFRHMPIIQCCRRSRGRDRTNRRMTVASN